MVEYWFSIYKTLVLSAVTKEGSGELFSEYIVWVLQGENGLEICC